MAYVSTPGLHEEFAQPNAAEPAALHFQEELARQNAAEPAALQGSSQEPTVEVTMSPPPDFAAQLQAAFLSGMAAGYPQGALGTPGLAQYSENFQHTRGPPAAARVLAPLQAEREREREREREHVQAVCMQDLGIL